MDKQPDHFSAPWLLGTSFLLLGAAMVEKGLNIFGWSLPWVDVFPRQLLDWAVALAVFEIALSLRHLLDARVRSAEP
ncbi:MAG: hypothetical protein KJO11_08730 [Gemmatimonadetes bacterium]|nr:hypothetical protein [Gemmatimonadota bacterium]NNK62622.1 hypothetical protein [Gemmatimonadota bacterium]